MAANRGPAGACTPPVALVRQLHELSTLAGERIRLALAESDLTESAAGVLWTLDPAAPPVPLGAMARILHCDPSNVTLISDRLEAAGLVERRAHPTDGRSRVLALTGAGVALRRDLLRRLAETSPLALLSRSEQLRLAALIDRMDPGSSGSDRARQP